MSDVTETPIEEKKSGVNQNSLDNLKPFQKGISGNPAGRKKGSRNRQTIVREILESIMSHKLETGEKIDIPVVEAMTRAVVGKALDGDVQAFKELMDSSYGKLTEKVETAHTFTQMGRVKAGSVADPSGGAGVVIDQPAKETKELTFDVGDPLPVAEDEDSEEDPASEDQSP